MAYQDRVIGRMVSPLWFQLATNVPSPPGIGGVGPGTPPTIFGVAEHVPEMTYISTSGEQGFLNSAVAYHEIYGLNGAGLAHPGRINSLEHLIDQLQAGGSHIGRLRIVSHVGLNTATADANMNLPFFNGAPAFIWREMLQGFAIDDETGLRAVIDKNNFRNPTAPFFNSLVSKSLDILRVINPDVLSPIGLNSSGTPSGDLESYFYICSDQLFVALAARDPQYCQVTFNNASLTAQQRTTLDASLTIIANAIKARLSGMTIGTTTITNQHLDDLRTAIVNLNYFLLETNLPTFPNMLSAILDALRASNPAVLVPFALNTSGTPASGEEENFFLICSDLLFVALVTSNPSKGMLKLNNNDLSAQQRSDLNDSIQIIFNAIKARLVASTSITDIQLTALRSAILGLSMADLNLHTLGGVNFPSLGLQPFSATFDLFQLLRSTNTAIGNSFRARLDTLRARFDEHSWIDVRGCRIGQDRDYLVALRDFFGVSEHQPSVSGATWYQSFPSAGFQPLNTEAQVDHLFDNGSAAHSTRQIQDTFDEVSRLAGIDIHITFWEQLTNGESFPFVAMVWKGSLPTLPIEAARLDGLVALDLSDTMTRLSQIFDVNAPAPATFTRIEARHAQIAALQTEINTIADLASQASPTATDLTASFNRLHSISQQLSLTTVPATPPASLQVNHLQTYSQQLQRYFEIVTIPNGPDNLYQAYLQIEALAAQASPLAAELSARLLELQHIQSNDIGAGGIVPATEPAALTAAQLQGYVVQLVDHLNGAADMVTFKQAVHTKTLHANAQFRYYFFIGLPLLVNVYHQNACYYCLGALSTQAIRSFMHAQWHEPLPAGNHVGTATMAQADARRISMLSEDDHHAEEGNQDPDPNYGGIDRDYVNPYPEFDNHIEKVPRP